MKAFTPYSKGQVDLNFLLNKLQKYGEFNCDFETFCKIYQDWHLKSFPGAIIDTTTVNFRDDWFMSFRNYLSNVDI